MSRHSFDRKLTTDSSVDLNDSLACTITNSISSLLSGLLGPRWAGENRTFEELDEEMSMAQLVRCAARDFTRTMRGPSCAVETLASYGIEMDAQLKSGESLSLLSHALVKEIPEPRSKWGWTQYQKSKVEDEGHHMILARSSIWDNKDWRGGAQATGPCSNGTRRISSESVRGRMIVLMNKSEVECDSDEDIAYARRLLRRESESYKAEEAEKYRVVVEKEGALLASTAKVVLEQTQPSIIIGLVKSNVECPVSSTAPKRQGTKKTFHRAISTDMIADRKLSKFATQRFSRPGPSLSSEFLDDVASGDKETQEAFNKEISAMENKIEEPCKLPSTEIIATRVHMLRKPMNKILSEPPEPLGLTNFQFESCMNTIQEGTAVGAARTAWQDSFYEDVFFGDAWIRWKASETARWDRTLQHPTMRIENQEKEQEQEKGTMEMETADVVQNWFNNIISAASTVVARATVAGGNVARRQGRPLPPDKRQEEELHRIEIAELDRKHVAMKRELIHQSLQMVLSTKKVLRKVPRNKVASAFARDITETRRDRMVIHSQVHRRLDPHGRVDQTIGQLVDVTCRLEAVKSLTRVGGVAAAHQILRNTMKRRFDVPRLSPPSNGTSEIYMSRIGKLEEDLRRARRLVTTPAVAATWYADTRYRQITSLSVELDEYRRTAQATEPAVATPSQVGEWDANHSRMMELRSMLDTAKAASKRLCGGDVQEAAKLRKTLLTTHGDVDASTLIETNLAAHSTLARVSRLARDLQHVESQNMYLATNPKVGLAVSVPLESLPSLQHHCRSLPCNPTLSGVRTVFEERVCALATKKEIAIANVKKMECNLQQGKYVATNAALEVKFATAVAAHAAELTELKNKLAEVSAGKSGFEWDSPPPEPEITETQKTTIDDLKLKLEMLAVAHGKELRMLRKELKASTDGVLENIREDNSKTMIELLRNQLEAAGLKPFDKVVSFEDAKSKLHAAVTRLMQGDLEAESELEEWDAFVRAHPDHAREERERAKKWEHQNAPLNEIALRMMRSFVPEDITTNSSLKALLARGVASQLARRLTNNRALWLVRVTDAFLKRVHIADLKSKYAIHGLDITELRAVWCVLSTTTFDNDGSGEKSRWKEDARQKLDQAIKKAASGSLSANGIRHTAYKNSSPLFDPDARPSELEHTKSTAFTNSYGKPEPKKIEQSVILHTRPITINPCTSPTRPKWPLTTDQLNHVTKSVPIV